MKTKWILIFAMAMLLSACNQKEELTHGDEVLRIHELSENDRFIAFTLDEEGDIYVATSPKEYFSHPNDAFFDLYQYDPKGTLIKTYRIQDGISNNSIGVRDGVLYYTDWVSYDMDAGFHLLSYSLESLEQKKVCDLAYRYIDSIVALDDSVFVLGRNQQRSMRSADDSSPYLDNGEKLVYYSIGEDTVYEIGVGIPINISASEDGNLLIYSYLNDQGYCLLHYNIQDDTSIVLQQYDNDMFDKFTMVNQGKTLVYHNIFRNGFMVLADLEEPTMEIDIFSNYSHYYGIQAKDDLIYLVDGDSNVNQLNHKRIRKETKVIEYITTGTGNFETFGSGYALNKNVLYPNEYALKVLSGDPDYDISVMNSALGESYNVKNNGAYYPLNKVKGMDDYLDACFPYVKEAAYNEQGDIWMIPLQVDIPGYLVNMKSVEKDQVLIKDNMTYDEFIELINTMDDTATNKYNATYSDIYRNLLYSVFSGKEDTDREKFSRIAEQLREVHKKIMGANQYSLYVFQDNYYFDSIDSEEIYKSMMNTLQFRFSIREKSLDTEDLYEIVSYPKLMEADKNRGYCTFLTINPNSKNLKATIDYLESYIEFILGQKTKPLFFQDMGEDFTAIRKSIYNLYENGEIVFHIDRDIYYDDFMRYLEGEIDLENYIAETNRKLSIFKNE